MCVHSFHFFNSYSQYLLLSLETDFHKYDKIVLNQYSDSLLFVFVGNYIYSIIEIFHVKWVPCHHGMARPQFADGGDGLQIWRVAANILNKQSRTADRGWSSSMGAGREFKTHHRKTTNLSRNRKDNLEPGRILWQNGLDTEKWI
jgi:hypothetical protein